VLSSIAKSFIGQCFAQGVAIVLVAQFSQDRDDRQQELAVRRRRIPWRLSGLSEPEGNDARPCLFLMTAHDPGPPACE
jgi:hypothetical protein